MSTYLGDAPADPLGDAIEARSVGKKAYAKVGSSRPPTLLYRSGPGAVLDLPHFTVMPLAYDAWERIWARRDGIAPIHAPQLLALVQAQLGRQVRELRPFPHQPSGGYNADEGRDLGVPAVVFPQWFRCTSCGLLARVSRFEYSNKSLRRPDQAKFEHVGCRGPRGAGRKTPALALPARYLLACTEGHLDEFPYDLWVHEGAPCPSAEGVPTLKMVETAAGRGASSTIECGTCGARRTMTQAQGEAGRKRLPKCRGRHPHLGLYEECEASSQLLLVGASNLWFPVSQSVIVMPHNAAPAPTLPSQLLAAIGRDGLAALATQPDVVRSIAGTHGIAVPPDDAEVIAAIAAALAETDDEEPGLPYDWSPIDLLRPEWQYLQRPLGGTRQEDEVSGLTISPRDRSPRLPAEISRVIAVDQLRKVNALLGFTRIDERDRINDLSARLVPLSVNRPAWTVATEDRGEGILLQLDEERVAAWEERVESSAVFAAHRGAHVRNFENRMSGSATQFDPSTRFSPPRYWLLHTLAHLLLREIAMSAGYSAASLTERVYAWPQTDDRPPAAGVLIMTTASDSDGTLGGLVRLSEPELLSDVVRGALRRGMRCSSDPICARRTPQDPEDFLHGAACHCCTMAAETSCEKANRFLDRRFVIPLPGHEDLAFFGDPR
jgi:hypothetical protein